MSPGVLEKIVKMMAIANKFRDIELDMTEFNILTLREQEILEVMSHGLNNRETAATLFISEGTIRSPTRDMVNHLDVGDRFQSVRYANSVFAHWHPNTCG